MVYRRHFVTPLATLRDLLLPGVVAHLHRKFGDNSGHKGDLVINGDALDLVVTYFDQTFRNQILNAAEIANNSYRDKFGPRMLWLLDGAADLFGS